MMANTDGQPGCIYHLLDNGIHEFTFRESSREAIDQFFGQLAEILQTTPTTDTLRYLVDITLGDKQVSLTKMSWRFRRLDMEIPVRARGRTAILHNPGALISFVDGFIRALAPLKDVTRFFPVDRRDEAIAWVLSEER